MKQILRKEYDLFCKKSKKKERGYQNKVNWIKGRFKEGLKFKLLLVKESKGLTSRGFIEYIPGEYNWRGVQANGWMMIHCIWVVGRNKNKGYGSMLLEECFKDAEGMHGVTVMTAKKAAWLPKNGLFLKHGFKKVDEMDPYFELYAKAFSNGTPLPRFYPISEDKMEEYSEGITILDSHQCPYSQKTNIPVKVYAESKNIPFQMKQLKDHKEAQQNQVYPYGTYCVLCEGKVVSHKPGSPKETVDLLKKIVE
ncbi:MAG: GNAT family N-acetyltransferase [Promethearchaeota archaeon]